jgi:hypothetical protein
MICGWKNTTLAIFVARAMLHNDAMVYAQSHEPLTLPPGADLNKWCRASDVPGITDNAVDDFLQMLMVDAKRGYGLGKAPAYVEHSTWTDPDHQLRVDACCNVPWCRAIFERGSSDICRSIWEGGNLQFRSPLYCPKPAVDTAALLQQVADLTHQLAQCAGGGQALAPCTNYPEFLVYNAAVTTSCCDEPSEECTAGIPSSCNADCAQKLLPMQIECAEFLASIQMAELVNEAAALCAGGH